MALDEMKDRVTSLMHTAQPARENALPHGRSAGNVKANAATSAPSEFTEAQRSGVQTCAISGVINYIL